MNEKTIVVGLGETGKPLYETIKDAGIDVVGIDIKQVEVAEAIDIMHICLRFQEKEKFMDIVFGYIKKYNPKLTIINSTVIPGTTREIAEKTGKPVVHSPIIGKHDTMKEDQSFYTKYIGTIKPEWGERAAEHFQKAGFKTKIKEKPETTEFMKLFETTYRGLLIGWAQEMNRICKENNIKYEDMVEWYPEIEKRGQQRPVMRPGFIGGHCIMPNIELLKKVVKSNYVDSIEKSNEWTKKIEGKDTAE